MPLEHPADTTLRYFFKRRVGSNERALIAETVFGVLRHRLFRTCLRRNASPRRMALARSGGYNLREIQAVLKREGMVLRASYSDEATLALGLAMQQGAPLDIRVNTLLAKRDDV